MKNLLTHKKAWLATLIIAISASAYAFTAEEDEMNDTINFKAYYGKVVDAKNGRTLPFATVEAVGSNIATVTNIDGEFPLDQLGRDEILIKPGLIYRSKY